MIGLRVCIKTESKRSVLSHADVRAENPFAQLRVVGLKRRPVPRSSFKYEPLAKILELTPIFRPTVTSTVP